MKLLDIIHKIPYYRTLFAISNREEIDRFIAQIPQPYSILKPALRQALKRPTGARYFHLPERWEEPIVQKYIKMFITVMEEPRIRNDASLESDFVYSHIQNPEIRNRMRDRSMTEQEYSTLMNKILESIPKLSYEEKALTVHNKQLAKHRTGSDDYLGCIGKSLMAVESSLSLKTVEKYTELGFVGAQIVDIGYVVKNSQQTNFHVAKELIKAGVEGWEELIETARSAGCSVKTVLAVMDQIGTKEADDIAGLIEECYGGVIDYAEQRHMPLGIAWKHLFAIYMGVGSGDITRTLDLFTGATSLDEGGCK